MVPIGSATLFSHYDSRLRLEVVHFGFTFAVYHACVEGKLGVKKWMFVTLKQLAWIKNLRLKKKHCFRVDYTACLPF